MQLPLHRGQTVGLLPNSKWHSWRAIVGSTCSSASGTTARHSGLELWANPDCFLLSVCSSSPFLLCQRLVQFPLIKVLFFRIERSRVDHSNLFAVSPIHTEH